MNELREKIDKILCEFADPDVPYEEQSAPMLDASWSCTSSILAVVEPQILTSEEARELLRCWKNESASLYGKVNRQAPLYLKLKGMVEGL